MKRILCLILALVMCFTLISCGEPAVNAENDTPVTDDTVQGEVNTEPEDDTGDTEVTDNLFGNGDGYVQPDEYFYDPEFDYTQNPNFRICIVTKTADYFTDMVNGAVEKWCGLMNLDYAGVVSCEEGEREKEFVAKLEEAALDCDGVILLHNLGTQNARYAEILNESGCIWLSFYEMRDYNDVYRSLLRPAVLIDYEEISTMAAGFLVNYAMEKFGNIDNVGFLYVEYGDAAVAQERRVAFKDDLFELAPAPYIGSRYDYIDAGNYDTYYHELGYLYYYIGKAAEWYPEIEHWMCFAADPAAAQELEQALIEYGLTDSYSVLTYGYDAELIKSWDAGESAHRIGIIDVSVMLHTEALVCGIYSMITGNIAPEDLWADWTDENEPEYAKRVLPVHLYTPDNYKPYLEWTDVYWNADDFKYDVGNIHRDGYTATVEISESYELETVPELNTFSQEYVDSCEKIPDDVYNYHPETYRYRSIKDLSLCAPDIITGKIVEVAYTNDDIHPHYSMTGMAYPYTVYTIEITEGIRGNLKVGDRITVLEEGGYLLWEKYNEVLDSKVFSQGYPHLTEGQIEERFYEDAPPIMEVGTELLLFLQESWLDCYEIMGSWTGCYYIENGEVWRYIEYPEKFVFGTLDEAKSEIETYNFNIDKFTDRYGYYN